MTLRAQSNFDTQRVSEVARVITALEAYADQNDTYLVSNSGYSGRGQGSLSASGGTYADSISGTLFDLGLLSAPLPTDPSGSDFLVYTCLDRVAVFSKADDLAPAAAHLDWWQNNACTDFPMTRRNYTYFELSGPLPDIDLDSQRASEVTRVITALEAYGDQNDTYLVSNSGYSGRGQGSFSANGGNYPNAISSTLFDLGLLTAPLPTDPGGSDFLVYTCLDRVAVFSNTDDLAPTAAHLDWWQDNGCTDFPMSRRNYSYFELSDPLPGIDLDTQRASEVARVIAALEAYGNQNFTYLVSNSGYGGRGLGSFSASGGTYANSISGTLFDLGLLTAPLPAEPSGSDLLVYTCLNRVAVFSVADDLEPEAADLDWWQNNSCTQSPINQRNATYFALSEPLPVRSPILSDYNLVFEDNFDDSVLNPAKWDTGLLWGPYLPINNEQQLYVDSLGMHSNFAHTPFQMTGESLIISATPVSPALQAPARPAETSPLWKPNSYSEYRYNGPTVNSDTGVTNPGYQAENVDYLSGIITSYGGFKMTHGYVEMRAKMSGGRGLWPAFWMLPTHYVKDVPEIDVMEFLGQDVDRIYNTYHYFDVANNWHKVSTPSFQVFSSDWTQDWHTYGMSWSPRKIIWYVDGIKTHEVTDADYRIANQAMYLIANIAVGGSWPGSPDATTPFPATMEIDYIRAYKQKLSNSLNLAADYQLMFGDEFNGTALDASKWNTHFLWGPYLPINNEEQYYIDALGSDSGLGYSPFTVNSGKLTITARAADDPLGAAPPATLPGVNEAIWHDFETFQRNEAYSPPNYTSGMITSYDSFKFAHGYAEIRAKIPKGAGQWPAFWLLNGYYVGQQPEIDILEVRGENPHQIVHSYHRSLNGSYDSVSYTTDNGEPVTGYADGFHRYGARWEPGKITWYIDGVPVHSYSGSDVAYQVMYVIANLAIGGNFNFSPVDASLIPTQLVIDYIRVYQEKDPE